MVNNRISQRGAVSLFVVVFTTLLITVITISFVRIMIRDQDQASTADLSQSAYDSAQAGVEDAKRAILRYQSLCTTGTADECAKATAALNSSECNASLDGIAVVQNNEVQVQQNIGDAALNQAYTCVKVALKTDDYVGVMQSDNTKVIPLKSTSSFNRIKIEWYSNDDLQTSSKGKVTLQPTTGGLPLLAQSAWSPNRPSLLRMQLMQVGSQFTLDSFDNTNAGKSNANTLFLYPSSIVGNTEKTLTALDIRKTQTAANGPQAVTCNNDISGGGYACSVEVLLPDPIGGGTRDAYLQLSAFYNKTNYRVSLSTDGITASQFDGVQPSIDSTGRANDLFRRVRSRVETVDAVYPSAAVDITGDFCKDFIVTDVDSDYSSNVNCKP